MTLNIIETIENSVNKAIERYRKERLAEQEYFNTAQASLYLGFSKQQLEIWRLRGDGPPYTKLSQAVRYKKTDLDDFMAAHSRKNTSEGGCNG